MLDDSFAHFKREIESWKARVALLEMLHDAQGVQIVIEAIAETAHLPVEFFFAGMREWRMSYVVGQRQRLGQLLIKPQHQRHRARNLRYLDCVCEAIAKVVGDARRKYLRLVLEPAE